MRNRPIIALAGNPNVGKTCLFNKLTGTHQAIGNWPGVTVELKHGIFSYDSKEYEIVDLPGLYSLSDDSPDAIIARNFILKEKPDLIINIVDASNLERNLYLTVQLMEMGEPLLICLSMIDIAEQNGIFIDYDHLSHHLGIEVIPMILNKHIDLELLISKIEKYLISPPIYSVIDYDEVVEKHLDNIIKIIQATEIRSIIDNSLNNKKLEEPQATYNRLVKTRWVALKLIEGDTEFTNLLSPETKVVVDKEINAIIKHRGQKAMAVIADDRYAYIRGLVKDTVKRKNKRRLTFSDRVDKFVLNQVIGLPIFFVVMYFVFLITVKVSQPFINIIEVSLSWLFVEQLGNLLTSLSTPYWLNYFLSGIIGNGIVTIGSFIPLIFFIYVCLSILEDSGYMARAAFIADKFMRFIGLPGKAFIPLLLGFGCTVPAIMATRTLENPRDRVFASLLTPFASCGAKLPVYTFLAMLFFPQKANVVIFSLYLFGIVMAVVTGLILKKTIFLSEPGDFVMELPSYHIPTLNGILMHTWHRLKSFLLRAGKYILLVIIIINVLQSIPINSAVKGEKTTILEVCGKTITPVFKPMGINENNWPASVALISGLFAKEAIVGSLQGLYQGPEMNMGRNQFPDNMKIAFGNTAAILAYLVFILLYSPCVASLTMFYKEYGFKWMLFEFFYLNLLAWMVAVFIYQILNFSKISLIWIMIIVTVFFFIYINLKRIGEKNAIPSSHRKILE